MVERSPARGWFYRRSLGNCVLIRLLCLKMVWGYTAVKWQCKVYLKGQTLHEASDPRTGHPNSVGRLEMRGSHVLPLEWTWPSSTGLFLSHETLVLLVVGGGCYLWLGPPVGHAEGKDPRQLLQLQPGWLHIVSDSLHLSLCPHWTAGMSESHTSLVSVVL